MTKKCEDCGHYDFHTPHPKNGLYKISDDSFSCSNFCDKLAQEVCNPVENPMFVDK